MATITSSPERGKDPSARPGHRGRTPKAIATRAALVELAAEMFAANGYIQTSIRDIAREASVTTGAIYGHFRNKAELLAEAISQRTRSDLETIPDQFGADPQHVEVLRHAALRYRERRSLRSLILQGAAAAVTDDETRMRLRNEQLIHLRTWIQGYEQNRSALGIDDGVDIRDAVLFTWAAEVGLGVLESIGIEPRSKRTWADMYARFGRSLTLSIEP